MCIHGTRSMRRLKEGEEVRIRSKGEKQWSERKSIGSQHTQRSYTVRNRWDIPPCPVLEPYLRPSPPPAATTPPPVRASISQPGSQQAVTRYGRTVKPVERFQAWHEEARRGKMCRYYLLFIFHVILIIDIYRLLPRVLHMRNVCSFTWCVNNTHLPVLLLLLTQHVIMLANLSQL